jgi:hypothetical protein
MSPIASPHASEMVDISQTRALTRVKIAAETKKTNANIHSSMAS